ncbi:MAG: nodulation protein NfeD [Chloroflexi bacterium]|nr:MAG: nodulation protein NfeD [Chloroflexota bacterium]
MPGRRFGIRITAMGFALLALNPQGAGAGSPTVLEASIEGDINSVTAAYVSQAVDRAQSQHAGALVLLMNTPGGDSVSMDQIVTTLLNARLPVIVYVSPVGARADSAGLFVAQAADFVAMTPGTNLGSAHPISATGADLTGDLGKKVLNDAVTRIRSLAAMHGRNADWCEKAVRESVNVNADEAVALHVADAKAADLASLLHALDGRQLARPHGGSEALMVAGATVEDASMSWPQQLLHALIDPNVAYLLLLVAIYGLIAEVSTPGAILPGTVGGISAILALIALSSLPLNLAGVLLVLFAFGLFIADLKAPTHGILTAGGVVALLLGSALLINTGPLGMGVSPWVIGGAAIASALFFGLVLSRVVAARRQPIFVGYETLIGRVGQAREELKPSGLAFVAGALWKATATAGTIPAGTPVRVVGQKGLELSVEPVPAEQLEEARC